jgi:hypothetical protein
MACEIRPLSRYHASSDAVSLQWASSLDGSRASSLDGSRASSLDGSRASTLGESRASTLGESRASTLDDNRASHLPYVTGTPLAPSPITTAIPHWLAADMQLKVQAGLLARARRGAARKLQAAARGAAVRKRMPSLLLSARRQSMHLARHGECAGGARALDASLGDSVGGSVDGPMDSQVRSSPGSLVMDPMRMTLADSERAMHGSPMVAMPPVALTGAASFAPGGSELAGVLQSTIGASCLLVDWGGQRHQLSSVARALRTRGAGAGGDYNELQTDGILLIPKAIPEDLCEQLLRKADTLKWHELWALKETQEDEKRRTFTLGHSKLKSACLELGSDIMSTHADYEDCPVFKPTMILGQHGAGDQSLHCDTDVTDTYSMLFAITNRVFHWRPSPDVPLRIVRMKRRDVLLFKANHCHGAGGVREQFTVLSIPGGGTVGLHMYGGRGILPRHLRETFTCSAHSLTALQLDHSGSPSGQGSLLGSLPQLGGRNALMRPDSPSISPEVDMGVSEGMLTSTAQVELALAGHEASGVTFMATPESPREVNNQSVAIESLESSRAPVDGMPVDNDGVSIVEAVIALEIALVKCICKLTAYNGAHGELVSSGSMVSSIRELAKRFGQVHPCSSTLTALTVAVAQRVWHDLYPSLRLATATMLPDGKGLRTVSTYASGLQRALVMLARHHGFRGYNLTDLADDMMSQLMAVAAQLSAD